MFYIEDDKIYLTRGDYGRLRVELKDSDGEPYALSAGEELRLTIREKPTDDSPKLLTTGILGPRDADALYLAFQTVDTEKLPVGEYSADIQVGHFGGAEQPRSVTVWPMLTGDKRRKASNMKNFIIMPEVTSNE